MNSRERRTGLLLVGALVVVALGTVLVLVREPSEVSQRGLYLNASPAEAGFSDQGAALLLTELAIATEKTAEEVVGLYGAVIRHLDEMRKAEVEDNWEVFQKWYQDRTSTIP